MEIYLAIRLPQKLYEELLRRELYFGLSHEELEAIINQLGDVDKAITPINYVAVVKDMNGLGWINYLCPGGLKFMFAYANEGPTTAKMINLDIYSEFKSAAGQAYVDKILQSYPAKELNPFNLTLEEIYPLTLYPNGPPEKPPAEPTPVPVALDDSEHGGFLSSSRVVPYVIDCPICDSAPCVCATPLHADDVDRDEDYEYDEDEDDYDEDDDEDDEVDDSLRCYVCNSCNCVCAEVSLPVNSDSSLEELNRCPACSRFICNC